MPLAPKTIETAALDDPGVELPDLGQLLMTTENSGHKTNWNMFHLNGLQPFKRTIEHTARTMPLAPKTRASATLKEDQ